MAVTSRRSAAVGAPIAGGAASARPGGRLRIWAAVGALMVGIELILILRWVSGPNFARVPTGPDQPPEWMRTALNIAQISAALVALVIIYRLLLRPWLRDRQLTLNGLLVIAGLLAAPWDGVSAYLQHWTNYNSYLFNRGSVLSAVPGHLSPNGAGFGQAWPFFALAAYTILVPGLGAIGSKLMRAAARRFPKLGSFGLIAVCVAVMGVGCLVVEATILLPLGFYHLGGGLWPIINGDHYYGVPLIEVLHFALFFSVPAVIRYFINDNGETIAERGARAETGSRRKKAWMRAFAVVGIVHVGFFSTYHLPVMIYEANSREYPKDVKDRSYFLGNYCGEAVDRACPGPDTPIVRPGSGYIDWKGNYVPPKKQ